MVLAHPGNREPRWGRAVTWLAAVLALPYPLVRLAWAMGTPLGVPAGYVEAEDLGGVALLGLVLPALIGAVLTLGLIQGWGRGSLAGCRSSVAGRCRSPSPRCPRP